MKRALVACALAALLAGCASPAPQHINRPVKDLTLAQLCYEMGYAKGKGDVLRLEDVQLEALSREKKGFIPDITKAKCSKLVEKGKKDSDGKALDHNPLFGGFTLGLGVMA